MFYPKLLRAIGKTAYQVNIFPHGNDAGISSVFHGYPLLILIIFAIFPPQNVTGYSGMNGFGAMSR
jgi:hypothetical protein